MSPNEAARQSSGGGDSAPPPVGASRLKRKRARRRSRLGNDPQTRHRLAGPDVVLIFLVLMSAVTWLGLRSSSYDSDWIQMAAASVISVLLTLLGVRRSKAVLGRLDFFHPLVFPLLYVLISFLAPIWATVVSGYPVGALIRDNALAPNTPFLLCLGVAGFAAGAALVFHPPRSPEVDSDVGAGDREAGTDLVGRDSLEAIRRRKSREQLEGRRHALGVTMLTFGRVFTIGTLLLLLYQQYRGGAVVRGINQTDYNLNDTVNVVAKLLPLSGVVLIAAGHAMQKHTRVLSPVDIGLLLLVVIGIGLGGSRNGAIAIILMVLFIYTRRASRVRWSVLTIGFVAAVGFVLAVLDYRNSVRGVVSGKTWWASILGDMAPAGFSVGVVANAVPSSVPYALGSTVITAMVRQLPSPVALALLGDGNQTGSAIFRDIAGVTNSNTGVGFSIPAEGYLNFGVAGLVLFCFLMGLVLAWCYVRVDLSSARVSSLLYPVLVGVLPTALRTDLLGAFKLILYPSLLVLAVLLIGRSLTATGRSHQSATARPSRGSVRGGHQRDDSPRDKRWAEQSR